MMERVSGFYEKVSEIADRMCNGEITQEEYCKLTVDLLDEFLAKHDAHADWIAHHYSSIAEYLLDSIYDDPKLFDDTDYVNMLVANAKREIEVFKKNEYDASMMESFLKRMEIEREEL